MLNGITTEIHVFSSCNCTIILDYHMIILVEIGFHKCSIFERSQLYSLKLDFINVVFLRGHW